MVCMTSMGKSWVQGLPANTLAGTLKQEPALRQQFNHLQDPLHQLDFLNHYFASTENQAAWNYE